MKKKSKSEFDIICDEIEEYEQASKNQIQLARKIVQKHMEKEEYEVEDIRLQLLAEAKAEDFNSNVSIMISVFSLCVSVLTLILSSVSDYVQFFSQYGEIMLVIVIFKVVILVGVIVLSCVLFHFQKKYKNVNKWRKYILMVLEQETN